MPRPTKCRRVGFLPGATYFKPPGIPIKELEEICLTLEEVEAVRLKDLEGFDQESGAEKMQISRPTFQRVLSAAHQKIADALINGKALRIEGGNYEYAQCRFKCVNNHEWDVSCLSAVKTPPRICPVCNSTQVTTIRSMGKYCPRMGHKRCCQQELDIETLE